MGLEEDLVRIIRIERLRDVSQKFSNQIKPVVDAFRARSRMRVITVQRAVRHRSRFQGDF